MGGLFWRFFTAIWLAIAGSIVIMVLLNAIFQILPPKTDRVDFNQMLASETIGDLLDKGDQVAAFAYADAIGKIREPITVKITPVGPAPKDRPPVVDREGVERPCRAIAQRDHTMFFAGTVEKCFRIDLNNYPVSFKDRFLPPILPFLAAMITSFAMAWLLAKYLVRPISILRTGLSALAKGIFSVRIGGEIGRRKDEVAALGKDFDVTAAKLEELQEGQKRLFHDVSHELRSPLSRMQAALGILRQNPGKVESMLPRMDREIVRLDGLVEEILTLARLGSDGSQNAERQTLDIVDLLAAIIEDASFEAAPRGIAIEYTALASFISDVNGELIYRALENVMRNAVKYSFAKTTIRVTAEIAPDKDALLVRIADEGPGVEADDLQRIFVPFSRMMENDNAPGHGLGLAIARQAIEIHGGSVWAEQNANGGLSVLLEIPRAVST
jgi:signal transduction histidine kinase